MIATVIGSGEYFIWVLMIASLFVYSLSEVSSIQMVVNGVQIEGMIGKVYTLFALQIGIGMSIAIFPFVKIILGYHWFDTVSSTFFTIGMVLLTLLSIRDVAVHAKEIEDIRSNGMKRVRDKDKYYGFYKAGMWFLILSMVASSIVLVQYKELIDTFQKDMLVVFGAVIYIVTFWFLSRAMIYRIGKNEEEIRNETVK